MQNTNWITNSEETPEQLDTLESKYDALERKYQVQARKEVEARGRAGLAVTPEWLDAIERKYQALASLEIANNALSQFN